MRFPSIRRFGLILCTAALVGCGQDRNPSRKPTFPVTGIILVDGDVPDSPLRIECAPVSEMDPDLFSVSFGLSNPDGSFRISTYESGDGAPDGEYVLTFAWTDTSPLLGETTRPDKLKGRYADPGKSDIAFQVEGQPVDLGLIELSTE